MARDPRAGIVGGRCSDCATRAACATVLGLSVSSVPVVLRSARRRATRDWRPRRSSGMGSAEAAARAFAVVVAVASVILPVWGRKGWFFDFEWDLLRRT